MEKSEQELEAECEKLRSLDRLYGLLVVSGTVLVLVGLLVLDSLTVAMVGIVPALIAVVFVSPRIHCPYCGRYLRMKFGLPDTCPYCGRQLTRKGPKSEK